MHSKGAPDKPPICSRRLRSFAAGLPALAATLAMCLLTPVLARAATIPTIGCNSTGYLFNTAYSGNPAGPPKTVGTRDTYWEVSREMETSASFDPPTGGWEDGYVVSRMNGGWAVSPYGNADWISHSATALVGGTPASPDGRRNYWYRYRFNLDGALDPSQFYMKLNFFADDGVAMVSVNGVDQPNPNSNYFDLQNLGDGTYQNYAPGSGAYLILDRNWQTGLNEILVHVVDRGAVSAFLVQYDGQSSTICTTTVTVNTVSQGGTGGFAYSGTNGVANHDVITTSAGTAAAGALQTLAGSNGQTTITQAVFGYELSAASCTGMAAGATQTANLTNAAVGDLPARSVRFADAGNGRDVTCTFTNNIVGDGGAHWDGTDTALPGNGSVQGGAGNWNAADTNWTAGNGTGNGKWVANGKAVFGVTGGAVEVSGTQAIGGLDFKVGGYSLTGGTLTGGLPTNVLSAGSGIGATIGSTLAGANAFEKAGAGSITLTGANTYSGGTTVSAGSLIIGGAGGTPGTGGVALSAAGTLLDFTRSTDLGYAGVISGAGAVTKSTADATLTLTGNNTYTGATTVSAGTLQVGNNTTTGSLASGSAISIASGATLAYYSSSDSTGNALIGNTFAGAGTLRFKGNAAQNQSSYTLSAPTHSLSGAVVVESGARLTRSNTGALGTAPITIESGGQLYLGGSSADMTSAVSIAGTGWNEAAGYIGALRVDGGATQSGNVTLTAASSIGTFAGTGTISGVISGGFALTKLRAGTTILTGNNTYTGATTVSAGTLRVGNGGTTGSIAAASGISVASGATLEFYRSDTLKMTQFSNVFSGSGRLSFLGTGTQGQSNYIPESPSPDFAGTVVVKNGARLERPDRLGSAAVTVESGATALIWGSVDVANGFTIAGNGWNDPQGYLGAIRFQGPGSTLSGNVAMSADSRIALHAANESGTITGAISGGFALEKFGAGTLTLSGANTYGGATTVSAGTLKLGADGTLPAATSATVASGATLNLDGKTQTLAGLASSGTLDLGTNGTLTISGDSSIGAVSGSGTIKVTGGTLTLTSAISNTSVKIELAGGTLALGALTHGIGTLEVSADSTLDMNAGTAQLTVATLTPAAGKLLTVSNWTAGTDHFYATAVTGSPARSLVDTAPLNQVKLGGNTAADTYWSAANELLASIGPRSYWDGAAADSTSVEGGAGTWSSAGTNWTTSTGSPNGAWTAGEVAVFGTTTASVTVNVTAAQNIGGLTFLTDGYTLTGSTLTGTAATNYLIPYPGVSATVGNVLAGGNAYEKGGNGVLTLTGANTFTGPMSVTGGALLVGHASALGTAAGGTTVGSGATLGLTGGITIGAEALTISGVGSSGGGALQNASGSNTWGGAITLGADSVVSTGTGTLTLSGAIGGAYALTFDSAGDTVAGGVIGTGAGTLTKSGAGTLTLNAANTYTGATTVSAGTLKLGINGALASASATTVTSGMLNINGKTQTLASLTSTAGTLNLGTGGTLILTGDSSIGTVTGSGTIKVTGGTLTLDAGFTNTDVNIELAGGNLTLGANTYSIGTFTITNDATLDMASGTASLTVATLTPATGKLLTVTNWTAGTDHFYATAITGNPAKGTVNLAPLNQVKLGSNAASATYWASAGNELLASAGPFTYWDGPAANTTSIETGNGTWDYSTRNWTTGTGTPNGVWTDGSVATFNGNSTETATLDADVTIAGLHNHANYLTIAGTGSLTLGASPTVFSTGSGNCGFDNTIAVPVKGTNGLEVGNVIMALRSVNTYTGGTSFGTCEFRIQNAGSLGSGNYAGNISSGGGLFRYSSSAAQTLSGVISGSGGLTKDTSAASTLTLSGANTYTGATTVSAGTLVISGTLYNISGAGSITVNSGATLRFDRSDTFGVHTAAPASTVTVAGGTVASNDTFNTLNNLTLSGGTLTANGGANAGYGAFALKGTVTSTGTSAFTVGTGSNNFIFIGTNAAGGTTTFDVTSGTLGIAPQLGDNRSGGGATVASNLAKTGAGTLTLSGANTYTGTTTVSAGTLKLGADGALPSASATTVASGATLNLDGKTQTLASLASSGTLNLGTGGVLTITGNSSIGAVTGSGTIRVTGGTLTLGAGFSNTSVNIELAGGNLTLGANTYSIGTFTIADSATLDMASGTASLTAATLTLDSGKALTVSNWTRGSDVFKASAFTGATRDAVGAAPMNQIALADARRDNSTRVVEINGRASNCA
ncbi:beta strand repeat-containing protein [Thauera sinica]|uniref:Beta strand repeat-containing protein n=2 Tax=Thauera TaxID=33057 RepID=A0ABW1ARK7_9RHOO|nr:hypothetical protein CCZ27_09660 [Thauera sp. K11]